MSLNRATLAAATNNGTKPRQRTNYTDVDVSNVVGDLEADSSEYDDSHSSHRTPRPPASLAVKEISFFDWSKVKLQERSIELEPSSVAVLETSQLTNTVNVLSANAHRKTQHANPKQLAQTICITFI